MLIEFQALMQSLKKRDFSQVYFLSGEEPYYIDIVSDYIENEVLNEGEKSFNQTVFYGKEVDCLTVLSAAKRYPMMSDYQVVIVKEAQNMRELMSRPDEDEDENELRRADTAPKKGVTHPLVSYLKDPQKQTILVFCFKYKTLDKRSALSKEILKYATVFESNKVRDYNLSKWIVEYASSINYKLSTHSASMIGELVGQDLSRIVNEISKLIITLPPGSEITADHINNNLGSSKDFNIFELQNALLKRDYLKTMKIAQYFAQNPKEHPAQMNIGALNVFFNKLLALHFLSDKSKTYTVLGNLPPHVVKEFETGLKFYTLARIKYIVSELRAFDLKIKGVESGKTTETELFKEFLFKVLH